MSRRNLRAMRDDKRWKYTTQAIGAGRPEPDDEDEDLTVGNRYLAALTEEGHMRRIAPGVYLAERNDC